MQTLNADAEYGQFRYDNAIHHCSQLPVQRLRSLELVAVVHPTIKPNSSTGNRIQPRLHGEESKIQSMAKNTGKEIPSLKSWIKPKKECCC